VKQGNTHFIENRKIYIIFQQLVLILLLSLFDSYDVLFLWAFFGSFVNFLSFMILPQKLSDKKYCAE
jgi:hypothetical protein